MTPTLRRNPHFPYQYAQARAHWGISEVACRRDLRTRLGLTAAQHCQLREGRPPTRWAAVLAYFEEKGVPWERHEWFWPKVRELVYAPDSPPQDLAPEEYLEACLKQKDITQWQLKRRIAQKGYGLVPRDLSFARLMHRQGLSVIPVLGLTLRVSIQPFTQIVSDASWPTSV